VLGVRRWRELVADREKMEGHCSTGQSPQWAVVPMEGEEEEEVIERNVCRCTSNRHSVITQFANSPLESSCVVVALNKIIALQIH
jgi:hypothetical protein